MTSRNAEALEADPLRGLTPAIIFGGASSRAKLEDVMPPRTAGSTRQGAYRKHSWQIPSKNAVLAFYTITVEASGVVRNADDLACSCSCPFSGTGWCKHIVRCLHSLVDDDADDVETTREDAAEETTRCPTAKRRRPRSSKDEDRVETTRPSPTAKRRVPKPPPLQCARCFETYTVGAICRMKHPRLAVVNQVCGRCGRPSSSAFCFEGNHETSLADVAAEGWPSDSD